MKRYERERERERERQRKRERERERERDQRRRKQLFPSMNAKDSVTTWRVWKKRLVISV